MTPKQRGNAESRRLGEPNPAKEVTGFQVARKNNDSRIGRDRGLTLRELEVLRLIVDGKSNVEIAFELGLSRNTVAVHRSNIMKTIGVHNTARLVVHAIREGLVENLT